MASTWGSGWSAGLESEYFAFGSELRQRPYADQLSDDLAIAVRFDPVDLCREVESIDQLLSARPYLARRRRGIAMWYGAAEYCGVEFVEWTQARGRLGPRK
jgi:hypothetical protein